jgi:hypothetical protein
MASGHRSSLAGKAAPAKEEPTQARSVTTLPPKLGDLPQGDNTVRRRTTVVALVSDFPASGLLPPASRKTRLRGHREGDKRPSTWDAPKRLVLDPISLEQALHTVAARLGVAVRFEPFDGVFAQLRGRGGLCRLQGKQVIIGDATMGVMDRIGVLAEGLSHLDTDAVAMMPAVRDRIDRYRARRAGSAPVVSTRAPHLRLVV